MSVSRSLDRSWRDMGLEERIKARSMTSVSVYGETLAKVKKVKGLLEYSKGEKFTLNRAIMFSAGVVEEELLRELEG